MANQRKQAPLAIWLHGASGRMGLEIQQALARRSGEFRLIGGSGRTFLGDSLLTGKPATPEKLSHALSHGVDAVIDFSLPAGNLILAKAFQMIEPARRPQVLVGTTGIDEKTRKIWEKIASNMKQGSVFIAPNTSRGVLATMEGALRIQGMLSGTGADVTIVETHHIMKKDAPSGTAKMLAEKLKATADADIQIVSVRGGGIFGEHEIRFMGKHDEIAITHRAYSRGLFAEGALDLAAWQQQRRKKLASKLIDISAYARDLAGSC
ncbi:MAG: hypothetical protein RIQ81_2328 [Pseudomonadota bacterium]|jgi:4-hydroxy-tetrahydrodipicolinate reductase